VFGPRVRWVGSRWHRCIRRCEPFESLESSGEVVGIDEVGEMLSEVSVGFVVEAFDGGFLECSIHAFDLSVGPGVFRLVRRWSMSAFGAGELEGMSAKEFSAFECELDLRSCRTAIAGRGEVHAVVGEHGMDLIGQGLDQRLEEVGRNPLRGLFVHLDEGELRGAVDRDQEIELALFGTHLGDIEMEVADRVGLEFLAPGTITVHIGKSGDAVPLQITVQRRPSQLGDGRL